MALTSAASARSFIFSASMPPVAVATVSKCIDIALRDQTIHDRLWQNVSFMKEGFKDIGFYTYDSETPIIPIFIVFLGIFIKNKKVFSSPAIFQNVVDTTGCGDAFFVITTLMNIIGCQKKLIPFIGNTYAGLHGQFFGNEKIISKPIYLKYLKSILNF